MQYKHKLEEKNIPNFDHVYISGIHYSSIKQDYDTDEMVLRQINLKPKHCLNVQSIDRFGLSSMSNSGSMNKAARRNDFICYHLLKVDDLNTIVLELNWNLNSSPDVQVCS